MSDEEIWANLKEAMKRDAYYEEGQLYIPAQTVIDNLPEGHPTRIDLEGRITCTTKFILKECT